MTLMSHPTWTTYLLRRSIQRLLTAIAIASLLRAFDSIAVTIQFDEDRCISCIRHASSSLIHDVTRRCEGYYCGPLQISYTYWAEAGKPGSGHGSREHERCARDKTCSEQAAKAYFKRFKRDCNNDGKIDCLDMAALHRAGPTSCSSDWFYKSRYWVAFNKTSCFTGRREPAEIENKPLGYDGEQNLSSRITTRNETLNQECLDCICDAVSGCNTSANNCGTSPVCGPFAISQAYWKDGKRPGASWTSCTRTKECSSVTMKNYMEKHKKDCNGDGFITCEDYAAIHRRGPTSCSNKDLLKDYYWSKFSACRANQKPTNDVNMVKVGDSNNEDIRRIPSLIPVTTTLATTSIGSFQTVSYIAPSTTSSVTTSSTSTTTTSTTPTTTSTTTTTTSTPLPIPTELATTITRVSTTQNDLEDNRHHQETPVYELTSQVLDVKNEPETSQRKSAGTNYQGSETSPAGKPVEESDYTLPDLPFNSPTGGIERPTSFDKAVIGIVGSPDFSRSYPPVPSIGSDSSTLISSEHQAHRPHQQGQPAKQLTSKQTPPNDLKLIGTDIASGSTLLVEKGIPPPSSNETNRIASDCLECICDASSNCDTTVQCISKQREKNRCGMYMISWNQYQESDISLLSTEGQSEKFYQDCTTDRSCAEKLINLYIEKHQRDCNSDGKIDCHDIAAIHRVGPDNCNSGKFLSSQYWKDFSICYGTDGSTSTVQPLN